MSEVYGFAILAGGMFLSAVGLLWLIVLAFGSSVGWGIGTLLLPPVGLVYAATHFRRSRGPLAMILAGAVVMASPVVINHLYQPPQEAITTQHRGELHGTLTGATQTDAVEYLKAHRDAAVLQMAGRADVTDAVLAEHVAGMPNLRELDLNDTPVTDVGLAVLASLPKLESLRIARTKVTVAGVEKHVLAHPKLREIDVGGLGVPAKSLRTWKNVDPQSRKYVN